jgi:hypothetical protein
VRYQSRHRILILDHTDCLQELKVLTTGASSIKICRLLGMGRNLNRFTASAKLSQIPYSFDNTLVANEVFPEGELMPIYSK